MCVMMLCSDDETGQCVSTGNDDDIHKAENKVLFDFLDDGGFLPSGIQLPAGSSSLAFPCLFESIGSQPGGKLLKLGNGAV